LRGIRVVRLRVAELLKERGMSWYELAQASGLSETQVYRLANSGGRFSRLGEDMLERLCSALDVQPGALLEWIPERTGATRGRKPR
jgi:DNA-binding Xre family transcriptional regulator